MPVLQLKYIFLAGVIAEGIIRFPYVKQYRKLAVNVDLFTMPEKILLFIAFMGTLFLPVLYVIEPVFGSADLRMPWWTGVIGSGALAASVWLFWRSHRDLGKSWSPTLQVMEEHSLKTEGVYRVMRHPMYASMWLLCLAQLLLIHNWVIGPAGLISFLPMYLIRVPKEEKMMIDHFGADYERYAARTGRILPRFKKG